MSAPEPRAALRRAKDGTVHPADPRLSSFSVDPVRVSAGASKARKKKVADDDVELTIRLPRKTGKRLRSKASGIGLSTEEAARHVLRLWADR